MQGTILKVRDEILPVFDLRKHFGSDDPERAIAKRSALIVRSQGKRKAFLIDELLFQSRIVHKKLGKELKTLKVGSGAAVLGDGSVALILDLPAFTEAAQA
jgi:two-component system chemotaxis sensor kinase CheA